MRDMPTDLAIHLEDDISLDTFIVSVREFKNFVDSVTDKKTTVKWTVKVREGSNIVALAPHVDTQPHCVAMVYEAAKRELTEFRHNSSLSALNYTKPAQHLFKIIENNNNVEIFIKNEKFNICDDREEVEQMIPPKNYQDYGTIEGKLHAVQDAHGENIKITIIDILLPKAVKCIVPENMLDEVLASFRKRVEVTGLIKYAASGHPVSIDVHRIFKFREEEHLPRLSELRGVFSGG